jgi:Fe2+ transport system protein B
MIEITEHTRNVLLEVAKKRKVYVEGNFLKILKAPSGDAEFEEYLRICKEKDSKKRKNRLEITKQIQKQNNELEKAQKENKRVNRQLNKAVDEAIEQKTKAEELLITGKQHFRNAEKREKEQNQKLTEALKEAEEAHIETQRLKLEAENAKSKAEQDLSLLQKKTQTELMGSIVRVALWVIMGVGLVTTALYVFVMMRGLDAKIIESTWSNLFGILLTNSFSIIGTIMGVKHATKEK